MASAERQPHPVVYALGGAVLLNAAVFSMGLAAVSEIVFSHPFETGLGATVAGAVLGLGFRRITRKAFSA